MRINLREGRYGEDDYMRVRDILRTDTVKKISEMRTGNARRRRHREDE